MWSHVLLRVRRQVEEKVGMSRGPRPHGSSRSARHLPNLPLGNLDDGAAQKRRRLSRKSRRSIFQRRRQAVSKRTPQFNNVEKFVVKNVVDVDSVGRIGISEQSGPKLFLRAIVVFIQRPILNPCPSGLNLHQDIAIDYTNVGKEKVEHSINSLL